MIEDPPDPNNSNAARKHDASPDEEPNEVLERTFLTMYRELLPYLENALGSSDAALDALQDTSEKLARRPAIDTVRDPRSYLRRMALNFGRNRRKAGARFLSVQQAWLEGIVDPAPDPEMREAARQDLAIVLDALAELPGRQRAIFFDKWRDGLALGEIAKLRGLHRRTVEKELKRAIDHLRLRVGRMT
ncbi:sigma-70 family RNA polymerase sigma factor [Novosphingobium sp. RL4]|uniref:RNA polymerase sigma factor n=1 Tax=Novosphingobium sp. RL4 TaxID=3109595 RepID=UPI002D77F8DA|nr:sigma-70 family RNA polymerase sigma factor [Novosphingobium sp. RL4]WRT95919.1 sigma-70 family RNA polymerase sigma factor [Novosphingobium sp. RL4]